MLPIENTLAMCSNRLLVWLSPRSSTPFAHPEPMLQQWLGEWTLRCWFVSCVLGVHQVTGAGVACRATSDDVQRAGRWAAAGRNASLWLSYLGSFCSSVALALAGFTLDTQKYCLPRSCLNPPAELQQTIFPWLEEKEAAVKEVHRSF
jgi:hypothetical protein